MAKWKEKRLGQIAPFKYGKSLTADKRTNGKYDVFSSAGKCGFSQTYLAERGIIIGRKGSAGTVYFSKVPFYCIDTAFYIDEINDDCHIKFLYYYMQLMQLEKFNNDAAVPGLNRNLAHKLKLTIPDFPTQERTAEILSAYDNLIENNNRRIELLEKSAQNLYKEWFVRFRFPDHEHTKFINGLPVGWGVKRIFNFGVIETGKTPPTINPNNYGGNIMFIKTPDMHGHIFVVETSESLSETGHQTQPKKLLPENSISVSCIGTGGVVAINAAPAHTNQQINSIMLHDTKNLEWLYFTAKELKETIILFGGTGATMTNLSKGKFEKLKLIYPTDKLVVNFHNKTKEIFVMIKNLMYQTQNLKKQRDLLLPRLMSGKLEV